MAKGKTVLVQGVEIHFFTLKEDDYISLTDITKSFPDGKQLVPRWIRNRDTLEFLGVWEKLNNPDFQVVEFDNLYAESGTNRFSLSVKRWVESTNAIGFQMKRIGKTPATFAHKDIALGFCYWLSPPFQLYLIKEFQRLKLEEAETQKGELEWNIKRTLAKVNYRIHTDAIKENLMPARLYNRPKKDGFVYASEADVLNVALFGVTAREWRLYNPDKKGNIRDYATGEQLLVLANLESHNAEFIKEGLSQDERAQKLNEIAIYQMDILLNTNVFPRLQQGRGEDD